MGGRPVITFLYLFLFHSLLHLTPFLSQRKKKKRDQQGKQPYHWLKTKWWTSMQLWLDLGPAYTEKSWQFKEKKKHAWPFLQTYLPEWKKKFVKKKKEWMVKWFFENGSELLVKYCHDTVVDKPNSFEEMGLSWNHHGVAWIDWSKADENDMSCRAPKPLPSQLQILPKPILHHTYIT